MTAATTTPPTYGPGRDNNGLPGARGAGILLSTPGSLCGLPRALIFRQAFRFSSSVIGVIKNEKMPNHPWNRVLFWWWRSSAVPQSRQNGPRVVLWTIQIKRPLCSWTIFTTHWLPLALQRSRSFSALPGATVTEVVSRPS